MNLREISSSDELTQQIVKEVLDNSPLIGSAQFFPIIGDSSEARKPADDDGGVYRAKNSNYSEKTSAPAFEAVNLTIFGDQIKTDRAVERRGKDVKSVHSTHLLAFARNMGRNLSNSIINDDGTANTVPGILTQMPAGQKITFGNNGTIVPLGNSDANVATQQAFLEELDALILSTNPDALIMNSKWQSRLTAIAKRSCVWGVDSFGRPVVSYNGVKIFNPGKKGDKSDIMSLAETVGASGNCASILAVRWGEETNFSLATSNGVNVIRHADKDNSLHSTIELDIDAVLVDPTAIGQLEGLRLSA